MDPYIHRYMDGRFHMYTYIFIHLYIFIYIIQEPPHLKLISFFFPNPGAGVLVWHGGSVEHHGCCDHCGVPGGDGYRHLSSGWEMAGAGGVGGLSNHFNYHWNQKSRRSIYTKMFQELPSNIPLYN